MVTTGRVAVRGANVDDMRRSNLALVLGLAHRAGRISRAEITRRSGLNRSTVGALVAELIDLGLLDEHAPVATNLAGRPSPVVSPREDVVAVSVLPEVDSVTLGWVSLSGRVLERRRYDLDRIVTPDEAVAIVAELVSSTRKRTYSVVGMGLAVPGLIRASDGLVVNAPNLGWRDVPLASMLTDAVGLPVAPINDASAGAVGESTFGAGRGARELVYFNGGAGGIGAGIIHDGQLFGGANGYAGELGHTLVNSEGRPCHCGARGCLETEVARSPLLAAVGLSDATSGELDEEVLRRFGSDDGPDPAVAAIVHAQLDALAIGVRNAVNAFNPELVLFGGFLGTLFAADSARLELAVTRSAIAGTRADVRYARAALGRDLIIVGAAEAAFAPLLADPATIAAS